MNPLGRPSAASSLPLPQLACAAVAVALAACSDGSSGGGTTNPPPATPALNLQLPERATLGGPGVIESGFGDFDGDGVQDLVEADLFGNALRFGLGTGPDQFALESVVPTPGTPFSVTVGDFDGDGRDEVATVCLLGGPVANGQLSTAGGGLTAYGGAPMRLAYYDRPAASAPFELVLEDALPGFTLTVTAGDLGQAQRTLVVPVPSERQVWLYRDEGLGLTLVEVLTSDGPGGLTTPLSAAVLDVDGDGRADVVAGEASVDGVGGGSLAVFRQNADGSFAAPTYELPAPEVPLLVRVDVDGDGVLDLAALELEVTGDSALLYRRSGGGALDTATEMLTGGRASTLAIADFDLDGALEAAIGLLDQSELLVRSVPTELDGGLPAVLQRFDLGPVPRGMRVLQTDALAFPDLAVSHALGTTFLVGSVDGLRGLRGFPVPIECHLLAVADFDGDGAGDVVTVDLFQRRLSLLVGTASAELIGAGEIEIGDGLTESPGGFDLADMDGDGDPDVVLAVYATGQVQVHPFRERIGNQLLFDAPVVISVGQQPIGIGAGDLDGDGFRDVVVTNSGDGTVEVLLGDGELGFVSQGAVAVEGTPLALVVRDLDGDGNLDVALTTGSPDGSGAGLRVLSGDGAGGLALEASLPLAHLATTLRAVDLDQDQDLELVANQTGLEAMGVVIAATDGGLADFATQVVEVLSPDDVDAEPATVLVARITADARPDLVVITASGRPLLFENSPGLEFGPAAFPAVGDNSPTAPFGTRYARLADLDGDELPELLLLAPDRPQVWVARAAPLAP